MNVFVALIISALSGAGGIIALVVVKPDIKKGTNEKVLLHICNALFVVGMAIYFSFLFSVANGEHLNVSATFEEYPIEKLTTSCVYFDNGNCLEMDASYLTLEEPSKEKQNIVVLEHEEYETNWLFWKIKNYDNKYHVYLSEDIYERYNKFDVVYEMEENL